MHELQTIVIDVRGVCLSRGSSPLHCTKTAEQMKMLFMMNSAGDL